MEKFSGIPKNKIAGDPDLEKQFKELGDHLQDLRHVLRNLSPYGNKPMANVEHLLKILEKQADSKGKSEIKKAMKIMKDYYAQHGKFEDILTKQLVKIRDTML